MGPSRVINSLIGATIVETKLSGRVRRGLVRLRLRGEESRQHAGRHQERHAKVGGAPSDPIREQERPCSGGEDAEAIADLRP